MQGTASTDGAHRAGRGTQGLQIALLPGRGVVRIAGPEAVQLLQGILTQDLDLLERNGAIYAGLLTPQGKILFDFFLARSGDALLLDAPRDKIADLFKRLTLYRLRAKVTFTEMPDMTVAALWGDGVPPPTPEGSLVFPDPRLAALGWRLLRASAPGAGWMATFGTEASEQAWHAHRIGLGVPEGGRDFAYGDAFPHEADMDQLAGVSFDKGCYIGQEVVSRMQHRGTARKRFVQVRGDGALTSGTAITAGTASIGSIASVDGTHGLALLRLDRAAEAKSKGESIKAGEIALEIVKPVWATFDMTPVAREASHDL